MKKLIKNLKFFAAAILTMYFVSCSENAKHDEKSGTEPMDATKACKAEEAYAADGLPEIIEGEVEFNTEEYTKITENAFKNPANEPLSTFSIDVDNASYSNVRRFLEMGQLPPADAVRIEEMINYFDYDYKEPKGEHPFSVVTEMAECPWNKDNKLVHIGIQGKSLDYNNLKPCNLVFLIDASGSMEDSNKLPLLKQAFRMLVKGLSKNDKVAIVTYAGAAGLVLPSVPATSIFEINDALDKLMAGGSTAGGEGIELAYKVAKENYIKGGNNRVILATDGDFNVGMSSSGDLVRLIEEKRKDDIYLTICGFGMGNYKDSRMEEISNAGNGNYFYIDNEKEAEKVFVTELRANLFTIAKDVKIQVEFNPANVQAYRLIGYENRVMNNEDFDDDTKDAGEIGAGHTVTAIYEIIPTGVQSKYTKAFNLKYQEIKPKKGSENEMMSLSFRYKPIDKEESVLIKETVEKADNKFNTASENFRFSAAVAGFGMLLRNSEYKGNLTFDDVMNIAKKSQGKDKEGYRNEFLTLIEKADEISKSTAKNE
ncbi:MAG: hypothetical protein A2W91_16510 [Bacteroidetes bacterium GWF2_38_335]|nr:MAG: hypothetical protein A2W91_16510 [Bacteroidetes bacterium GWF2_38_335]OFY81291.1 MAG: hypothetical protein A2281_07485 [Bacteroidetes bacterium RIFOXYA12_FULL_38_20]HBS85410.1 hypothetical protein [Bacteroidales bacterium]